MGPSALDTPAITLAQASQRRRHASLICAERAHIAGSHSSSNATAGVQAVPRCGNHAAGHAQRVGSLVHGDRNERCEIVCRSEHDRLDASFACPIGESRPRCLIVAGSRIDQ